mgnify:CR=1 FL=1
MINIVFLFCFSIPMIMILLGVLNNNMNIIESGITLMFFLYTAYLGSCIKTIKQLNIPTKKILLFILLLLFSMLFIILGNKYDFFIPSCIISFTLGLLAIYLMLRKRKNQWWQLRVWAAWKVWCNSNPQIKIRLDSQKIPAVIFFVYNQLL